MSAGELNAIAQQYIEELQTDPQTLGIILFGSWARGNNRPDSDVDLLVIVQDGLKRTVEYREGQAFEITYTTEQGAIEYWESNPNDAIELWNVARILFDRDGTVARLQKAGDQIKQKGKRPFTAEQYKHYKFDVYDQLKAIEKLSRSDLTTARMLLSLKVFQLTDLFFDLRQIWTPPPKQRLGLIKDMNQDLYDLISRYHDQHALLEQIRLAKSIADIVFDETAGLPNPAAKPDDP